MFNWPFLYPYKKIGYVFYKVFIRFFSLEITYHNRIRKNAQFRITKNRIILPHHPRLYIYGNTGDILCGWQIEIRLQKKFKVAEININNANAAVTCTVMVRHHTFPRWCGKIIPKNMVWIRNLHGIHMEFTWFDHWFYHEIYMIWSLNLLFILQFTIIIFT